MPKYAILRFEKHKGHPAAPLEAHHERQKEKYASNPDNIKMVKVNATKCITTNLAATPTATPTPSFVYSDELKLAESQKHTSYYFSVTEVTDDTVHLISATNAYARDYILVKPENLDLKEGTLLKIVNPVINTESQTDM